MLLGKWIKLLKDTGFFTSVMVPVSVRVPVLVLELTVVLGHKSDLDMHQFNENSSFKKKCIDQDLLLERLDIAEAAKSSLQSSSTPSSSRQYTLLKCWPRFTRC